MAAKLLVNFPVKAWAYLVQLEPGKTYDVGPDSTHRITIPLEDVADDHAEFVWRSGNWIVRDLGSEQGTFVNGQRMAEKELAEGDSVRIGECDIVFQAGPAEPQVLREKA